MSFVLRPAVAADATRIADVLVSSRRQFLPYAPLAHSMAEMQDWVAAVLVPSGGVTVAMDASLVVGVVALSQSDGIGWIDQMYVAPTHVGQGIGALLLDHAMAVLPSRVRLHTFQQNQGARRFYEWRGFRAVEFTDGSANEERCPDVLYER